VNHLDLHNYTSYSFYRINWSGNITNIKKMSPSRVYYTLNYPSSTPGSSTFLTGIRGVKQSKRVYISGFDQTSDGLNNGLVYKGLLSGNGEWHVLNYPSSNGITVTGTSLYGPNNGRKCHTVQVVGSYTTQETGAAALGCLYEGPLDGTGKWTTLIPKSLSPSEPIINTIAHSTMGGLVVGNYDTRLVAGKAFLYDIKTHEYFSLTHPRAVSITAYGIWHNCGDSYTICGSYTPVNALPGLAHGYIAQWNHATKRLSHFTSYSYNNDPSLVTHFDGITSDGHGGYNLTGDAVALKSGRSGQAFFAHVEKLGGTAQWEPIAYPNAAITSGNTVYKSTVLVIYTTTSDQINGYVSVKTKKETC
jgi:hypothetical protein